MNTLNLKLDQHIEKPFEFLPSPLNAENFFHPVAYENLVSRITTLNHEAIRIFGQMEINQMLNHLTIATGCGLNIYDLPDESNFFSRHILKHLVLRVLRQLPRSAKAPDCLIQANTSGNFLNEKARLLEVLQLTFRTEITRFKHPFFGKMSRNLWGILVYRHVDHHLKQFSA